MLAVLNALYPGVWGSCMRFEDFVMVGQNIGSAIMIEDITSL
jgi:hypothetical protein